MSISLSNWIYDRENQIYWILVLALLTPIWLPVIFVTLDGPAHLAIAHYWQVLASGNTTALNEFFQIKFDPDPNLTTYVLLRAFLLVVPAAIAEKLLATVYVIAMAAAARFAAQRLHRETAYFSYFFLLIIYNIFVEFGFYNFLLGLPCCLLGISFWVSTRENPRPLDLVGYFTIFLLCYFTHLIAFAALICAIFFYEIQVLISQLRQVRLQTDRTIKSELFAWIRGWLPIFLTSLPAVGLTLWFLASGGDSIREAAVMTSDSREISVAMRVGKIITASSLANLHLNPFYYSIPVAVIALFALFPWVTPLANKSERVNPYSLILLFFLCLVLFLPEKFVIRWVVDRMQIYFFLFYFIWLLGFAPRLHQKHQATIAAWVISVIVVYFLLSLPPRVVQYMQSGDYMQEYLSIQDALEPNHTVLGLRVRSRYSGYRIFPRHDMMLQAPSHFSARRTTIGLKNIQIGSGVTPVIYRRERNPFLYLATDRDLVANPPQVDIKLFEEKTGKQLDYIVLWGDPVFYGPKGHAFEFLRALEKKFRLVTVSKKRGLVRLYQNRKL